MSTTDSSLELAMLGLNGSAPVVAELLRQTTFPTERPSYWTRYPQIVVALPTDVAIEFARNSVMHAITIALSKYSSTETLDKLSRFTQKSVRRQVAQHRNLSAASSLFLMKWAMGNDDIETRNNLGSYQHPSSWLPLYQVKPEQGLNRVSFAIGMSTNIATYAASLPSDDRIRLIDELASLLEMKPANTDLISLYSDIGKGILDKYARSENRDERAAQYNAFVLAIPDPDVRFKVVTRNAQDSHAVTVLTGETVDALIAHSLNVWRVNSSAFRSTRMEVPPDRVDALLELNEAWANNVLISSVHMCDQWTDEQFNEVSVRVTQHVRIPLELFKNQKRLTDYTLSHLVMHMPPSAWISSEVSLVAKRLPTLHPAISLALALRMPSNDVRDFLWRSEQPPSFSPEDLLAAVSSPLSIHRPGNYTAAQTGLIPICYDYLPRYNPENLSVSDKWQSAVESLVPGIDLYEDRRTEMKDWILQLLNISGELSALRAVSSKLDPTRPSVFVFAVHYWLDKYLYDAPKAWLPALSLLPGWTHSLEELAFAALDSMGLPVGPAKAA